MLTSRLEQGPPSAACLGLVEISSEDTAVDAEGPGSPACLTGNSLLDACRSGTLGLSAATALPFLRGQLPSSTEHRPGAGLGKVSQCVRL